MVHVLHLSSEFPPQRVYGLGRYVQELAEAQAAHGDRVEIITNSLGGEEFELFRSGVTIQRVHFPPPPKSTTTASTLLHFNMQLIERAIEAQIDGLKTTKAIINAHDWLTVPAAFHLGRMMNRPVVTTFHDVIFNKVQGRALNAEDVHVANLENWACHFSAKIIVLSESVKQELISHYHAEPSQITVVPGGVGIKPLTTQDFPAISEWRRSHATDSECLLLYAGRLDREKGLPTLLDAVLRLREKQDSGWKLLIAGNGQLEDWLKQFVADHRLQEFVCQTGYLNQPELRLAYGAADAVIVPSYYEPFGLVALEAQKLATPIIVSLTGGLSESFARTGGGLSFAPGNSESLALCMKRMVNDPNLRKELGLRGKLGVSEHYEWPSIAEAVSAQLESISSAFAPQLVDVPAWTPPHQNGVQSIAKPEIVVTGEPLGSLSLFWDSASLEEAIPLLQCLCELHAIKALNGRVNLIPVVVGDGQGKLNIPFVHPRFNLVKLDGSISDFKPLLSQSAGIIVQSELMHAFEQSRLLPKGQWPIIWYGQPQGLDGDPYASNIEELYALGNKLLCDERRRSALAPEVEQRIPQVHWETPYREKPLVLHILPQLVTGGAETMLLALVKSSLKHVEHRILCLGPMEGFLPNEFEEAGVPIENLSSTSPSKTMDFICSLRPDLLHLHSMSYVPSWIPIHRRLAYAKFIETEHVVNIGSGHFGPVDTVVCVSQSTLNPHLRYLPLLGSSGPAFQVIYNGIDTDAYSNLPAKREARTRLNLPVDRPIIGRVSALARNKLPQEALEVLPIIKEKVHNAFFAIIGDGPQRKDAEAWVTRNGLKSSVCFLGERKDIPQILPAFDVFAYYTSKEALGNVILEAVAAGIPVVTTDIEGTREALGHAPGTLIPLNDYNAFASAVHDWVKISASPMPRHELPIFFTQKGMTEKYIEVYRSMLSADQKKKEFSIEIPEGSLSEKVTVLMPAFNSNREYLSEALHSLSSQSFSNWELLIVNDGSDPEWTSWITNKVDTDNRFKSKTRILHLSSNQGVAAALNAGLEAAETELIARMDSDDRLLPERLALQVATFKNKPHLSLVGGWARLISAQGDPLPGHFTYPNAHRHLLNMLGSSCAFAHPSVMYRKSAIKSVAGYRSECRHYEDYDLWVRLADKGHLFENLPIFLIEYRLHENSISCVHRERQSFGSRDCAERARTLCGERRLARKPRVIFTGVHNSYGRAGARLSDEQFFFARALQHMPQLEALLLPADLLIRKYGQKNAGERLIKIAEDQAADLIFTVLGNPELDYLPEHIRQLTGNGLLTINWNCDDHWRFPHTSKWAPNYSHMVTTDPESLPKFDKLGLVKKIVRSQWACNPFDYHPGGYRKDIDVCFIGLPYGNRPEFLDHIRNHGIRIQVFGAGWSNQGEITFYTMLGILQRSKIALNFSRASQGNRKQIKARFFEIPACGTFMLTEPADGMDAYLTPGRHYDTFNSPPELLGKIRYWLDRKERDAYALEASAIIRSTHTYARRLEEIFEFIGLYDRPS